MDYRKLYYDVVALKEILAADHDDPDLKIPDYRRVKALAACYELQDFLANELAVIDQRVAELEEFLVGLDPENDIQQIMQILEELQQLRPADECDTGAAWQDLLERIAAEDKSVADLLGSAD